MPGADLLVWLGSFVIMIVTIIGSLLFSRSSGRREGTATEQRKQQEDARHAEQDMADEAARHRSDAGVSDSMRHGTF